MGSAAFPPPAAAAAAALDTASPMEVDDSARPPLVTVFDWDDTLCPTSWMHRRGLLLAGCAALDLSPSERARLAQLEDGALALLHHAAGLGPVVVVTAARAHWVLSSAARFLPRVHALLTAAPPAGRLELVSAREWYLAAVAERGGGVSGASDPLAWKTAAFEALCGHLQARRGQRTDLVSVGDAPYEREACARMEQRAPALVRSKTLKLVAAPSLDELADELAVALAVFDRVCQHDAPLHLEVTRGWPGAAPLQLSQVSLALRLGLGGGSLDAHRHADYARPGSGAMESAAPLVSPMQSGRG